LERSGRQEKKLRAYLRAQIQLKQNFERIDYYEDTVQPMLEKLKSGRVVLMLNEGDAFDMQVKLATDVTESNENNTCSSAPETDATRTTD
jgi:predicted membrane-bound spermidine synthase